MLTVRKSKDRGHMQIDWLDSWHTFSFGEYHDPKHQAFSVLRVINEDFIEPASGFPTHFHRDMEILTYMVEGELEHKDTLGSSGVIRPGELQRMSAGKGIEHSEFNASSTKKAHLLQIWIFPDRKGYAPDYEQKSFEKEIQSGELTLLASKHGSNGSISVRQDIELWVAKTSKEKTYSQKLPSDRCAWLQVVKGEIHLLGQSLIAGDGAAIVDETSLEIQCSKDAEFLFFDLPK